MTVRERWPVHATSMHAYVSHYIMHAASSSSSLSCMLCSYWPMEGRRLSRAVPARAGGLYGLWVLWVVGQLPRIPPWRRPQGGAQHASSPLLYGSRTVERSRLSVRTKKAARHGRKLSPGTHWSASEGPYRHPYHSQGSCDPGDRLGEPRRTGSAFTIRLPFVTARSTDNQPTWPECVELSKSWDEVVPLRFAFVSADTV